MQAQFTEREIHVLVQCLPFMFLFEKPYSRPVFGHSFKTRGRKGRSAHGLQTRNLLGEGVAEGCGVEAAEKVPL